MASTLQTATHRGPLSSNSAADFVKLHGQEALGGEVQLAEGTTYDVELDKFMPTAELAHENHYEPSTKTLEDFKKTLETFKKTLRKNRVGEKLNVQLKDQYNFEDVMDIATKLKESHDGDGSVGTCMTKIKHAFRHIGKRKGVLANLLNFAPNDSYGIILCGGFTVILGAIDRADTLREELYAVLADIPWKMSNVHDMLELHKKGTAALHKCADAVFVAMFSLLTAVINRLSKGVTRKLSGLVLNGKEYGRDVKDAKKELDSRLEDFKEQARICAHRKLARIEEQGQSTDTALHKYGGIVIEVKEVLNDNSARLDAQDQKLTHLTALIQNSLYHLFGSSDLFNTKSGSLNRIQADHKRHLLAAGHSTLVGPPTSAGSASKSTIKYGEKWLKATRNTGTDHITDMEECLQGAWAFSHDDKAQIMSAMQSEEVSAWVQHPKSCLLIIDPETSPDDVVNPVSFVSALMIKALKMADTIAVLAVFCALRAEESTEEAVSGPLGLVTQLNAQLIKMAVDHKWAVDLSILKRTNFAHSHQSTKHALKLFRKLFELVLAAQTTDGTVYLIVDGLSSVPGDEDDVCRVVSKVLDICQDICEEAGTTLKVVLSDPTQEVLEDDSLDFGRKLLLAMGGPVSEIDDVDSEELQQDASLAVGLTLRSKRNERRQTAEDNTSSSQDSDSDSE